MTAERRIGKTTVIRKMLAEPASGWKPVFQDLEACHTAGEFAEAVYREIHSFLSAKGKTARRAQEWFRSLGGAEVGGIFRFPERSSTGWKDVLTSAIEDLIHENDHNGIKLLFLWDELPFMLGNIRDNEGERTAMQVLDVLRTLRQTHVQLRMIITGSIGLHHVVSSLKDKGYANAPINDMARIEVPPLSEPDAIHLAKLLIAGEELESPDLNETARTISTESDCFAFYIHHIVQAMKRGQMQATPENAKKIILDHFVSSDDPWELQHYRLRIPTYYGDAQSTVLHILDELAIKPTSSLNDLLAMLKSSSSFDDREELLNLLALMERDHYLIRDTEGFYKFRFSLIQRWWKLNRGL